MLASTVRTTTGARPIAAAPINKFGNNDSSSLAVMPSKRAISTLLLCQWFYIDRLDKIEPMPSHTNIKAFSS
jgi:hypothetical protein